MRYDVRCTSCLFTGEISKPMTASLPACPACKRKRGLQRVFSAAPAVVYAAGGFYATDVQRFKSQVGPEHFARFEKTRDAALKRRAAGRQTAYERIMEAPPPIPVGSA